MFAMLFSAVSYSICQRIDCTNIQKYVMKKNRYCKVFLFIIFISFLHASYAQKEYSVQSPDKTIQIKVQAGDTLTWSVASNSAVVLKPSSVSLQLSNDETIGKNVKVRKAILSSVINVIHASFYKKANVPDKYNQLLLHCSGDWGIIFRAYNDGVAYRFFTEKKDSITVVNEEADFAFLQDDTAFLPYAIDPRVKGDFYATSFEALYKEAPISSIKKDSLIFLPVLVNLGNGQKAVITEADQQNYPGMYINGCTNNTLSASFAPYPLAEDYARPGSFNYVVTQKAGYIAKLPGKTMMPWRTVIISSQDKDLLNTDMVYKLAEASRLKDTSWIHPGKVSWDWWNNWNISGVEFKAGINTATYKYYIDFAAANKLDYIVLDEGWSDIYDLLSIKPNINLEEIVEYGKQKGVGVILWAVWHAINRQMDTVFPKYEAMGVKGFKIDFLDRDDQKMVASTYTIARKAAEHHLLVDYHGVYKPSGLTRTYPNIIGYEGVRGMENTKWSTYDNMPRYDVSIPFIRMVAGVMDYTPGAMRNANRENFRPVNGNPMSQGTRVHQMAMYTLYEAPLQMLCDNPTAYMKEQECTDFIAKVPTVFDETVALDGKVGEYAALAKRKGDTWFVGAMADWTPRQLTLDCSFLGDGQYEADIFSDGVNADRQATDYKRETRKITKGDKLSISMAPGGGWTARIYKVR